MNEAFWILMFYSVICSLGCYALQQLDVCGMGYDFIPHIHTEIQTLDLDHMLSIQDIFAVLLLAIQMLFI